LVGCNSNAVASDDTNENVDTSRFKVLLKENIADGPLTEVTVTVLVDKVTRVMYVQTVKSSFYGYRVGLTVMAKPLRHIAISMAYSKNMAGM